MENLVTKGTVIRKKSEKLYVEKDGCFVFRDGTIFKVDGRSGKMNEVKQNDNGKGYLRFYLNGKPVLSHRFIWEAFFGPIPSGMEINHRDEDKQNNNIENLEMCDHDYNINHGTRNERVAKANTNGKRSKPVNQYNMDGTLVATYPSVSEAERQTGFYQGGISLCCNGKQKSYKNYIWRYVEKEDL